jgi:hypothetical protein
MRNKLAAMPVIIIIAACSSSRPQMVRDHLDDVKGKMGDKEIGYTGESEKPVIQESVAVEDELREMTWKNYEAERKLHAEHDDLIDCRTTLADPRLGGKKKLAPVPDLELAEDMGKIKEKIGLTQSNRLKIERTQSLEEKIELQRRYNESLTRLMGTVAKYNADCQRDLGYARVGAGLSSAPEKAKGHYDADGHFIVEKKAEENLDDAFSRARSPAGAQ